MGGIAAMNSLERLLEKHHDELVEDAREDLPDDLNGFEIEPLVGVKDDMDGIEVVWRVKMADLSTRCSDREIRLLGPTMDFDWLVDEYPDCEMGR